MEIEGVKQIPITILTGFLGSGKTTLLNYILKSDHGLNPAVLVNDFGKINIDAELIESMDDDGTVNLSNGCICCSIRGDLINAVVKQYSKPNPPDYIIIECSGVSHTGEVVTTFMAPGLKPFLKLDGIIAVVDSEQISTLSKKSADLARIQIELATVVILNKIDLISKNDLQTLKEWIRTIVPEARILEADHGRVPLEFIIGVGNFDPLTVHKKEQCKRVDEDVKDCCTNHSNPLEHVHHDHDIFSTFSYASDEPFNSSAFRKMIQRLPASIFRAKGIIYSESFPDKKYIFQIVGRWVSLTLGGKWGKRKPHTHLVMIGEKGKLDVNALTEQMKACLEKNVRDFEGALDREPLTRKLQGIQ